MLTIYGGKGGPFCDGLSRRSFLCVGGLVSGALTLADWLGLNAASAQPAHRPNKSIIMVCLGGGPSHLDMYDMKPAAPVEIRGELRPMVSKVPGMPMCELMPRQAQIADRLAVVRSLQWTEPDHQFSEICTGFPVRAARPSFGSIVNRLHPDGCRQLPRFVALDSDRDKMRAEEPRYAGPAYRAFHPSGQSMADCALPQGFSLDRLADRRQLLSAFDGLRRDVDVSGEFAAVDAFTRQAFDVVTSAAVREALDLSKEPQRLVDRYGDRNARYRYLDVQYGFDHESFIRARRLVEAGVPFVSLSVARWDHHCLASTDVSIFNSYRTLLPLYDMAVSALVQDLHDRGLSEDVAVVVWGEFGRTPRVNPTGGRDHWPSAGFALVAGGGLRMGQYVGETDARGERPRTRVYTPQNMLATLYHVLDLDPATTLRDNTGRPRYLLDDGEPIRELL